MTTVTTVIQRRLPRRSTIAAVTLLTAASACSAAAGGPADAVSEEEARTAVAAVITAAAQRTPEAMQRMCADNDGCPGTSSAALSSPGDAPDPRTAPRELCVVALPATPSQAGSRLVVLEGFDGRGQPYVSQVLVDRAATDEESRTDGKDEDDLQVQEPAFWLGIVYSALQHGRARSTATDAAQRQVHNEQARRACTDTEGWIAEVATRNPEGESAAPSST